MRDVFISYSHKDNLTLSDDLLGWVDRFHRALSVRLTQLLGRDSTMFFDKSVMSGSHKLSPKIRSEITETKILVSIVSPGYLQSEWCNEELEQFALAVSSESGFDLDTTSRIIKVVKLPVVPELERKAKVDLSDVLGYKFYRTDQRGVASEFDLDDEPQSRREFIKRVNELAYDVHRILDVLGDERPNRSSVVPPSGKVVYVAETTSDLAEEHERLRAALLQYGHTVVPRRALPHTSDFSDIVAREVAEADLAVHLVGAAYALIPEREQRSVVELQWEASANEARRRAGLQRMVWSPPNTTPDDVRQERFLAQLDEAAERIVTSFESLKTSIGRALEAPAPELPPVAPLALAANDAAQQGSVYLIFDLSDREAAAQLDDALFGAGFDVLTPIFEGDEARIRAHDERCVAECDAVLLFAANAPADWLVQRALDLQRAPAYGRERPFLAQAVALATPRTPDKDRFRRQAVTKIELYDGVSAAALEPFFNGIARARSVA